MMRAFSFNPDVSRSRRRPRAAFLAATSLTFFKPRFRRALRPLVGMLFRAGVTANQVTVTSLIGSLAVGGLLLVSDHRSALFGLLPAWQFARMGLATIDGTLAIDFGQKSRLGGCLNEAGDMLSDVALFAPLSVVAPFQPDWVALVIALSVLCEVVGIVLGAMPGCSRRLEGPFGKVDRSLALGAIGVWIECIGSLPGGCLLFPVFTILLLVTILNRVCFGAAERDGLAPAMKTRLTDKCS
jgi:CDP-diacylglycerol---glycerol-3-phosphate 3-phosphatidyltransferase